MSLQNASKFIDLLLSDKAMQERTAGMKPEEVLAYARELGLECTLEELKEETLKSRELSPNEMEQTAGGSAAANHYTSPTCPKSPDKKHKWVKTGEHLSETLLFLESWDVFYTCEYCMKSKRVGESGWAW